MPVLASQIRMYRNIFLRAGLEIFGAEEGDMLYLGLVSGYQRGGQLQ